MPFPWLSGVRQQTGRSTAACVKEVLASPPRAHEPNASKAEECEQDEHSESLRALYTRCSSLGCIRFALPPFRCTAGVALRSAIRQTEALFRRHEPLIFKFGFTHSPLWRWTNGLYGYANSADSWSEMVILYVTKESSGAAMMEAALIEKYQSISNRILFCHVFF